MDVRNKRHVTCVTLYTFGDEGAEGSEDPPRARARVCVCVCVCPLKRYPHGIAMKALFRFLCKGPARTFKRAVIIPY